MGPGLTQKKEFGKWPTNSPILVLICYDSIPCVFYLCNMLLKVVISQYDLSVLSMSARVSKKRSFVTGVGGGVVSSFFKLPIL